MEEGLALPAEKEPMEEELASGGETGGRRREDLWLSGGQSREDPWLSSLVRRAEEDLALLSSS